MKSSNEDCNLSRLVFREADNAVQDETIPPFVDAMQRILQLETAETFIIARGKAHTVREFAKIAFDYFDLDWKDYVTEDPSLLVRHSQTKISNSQKLFNKTGWHPSLSFADMIRQLIGNTLANDI